MLECPLSAAQCSAARTPREASEGQTSRMSLAFRVATVLKTRVPVYTPSLACPFTHLSPPPASADVWRDHIRRNTRSRHGQHLAVERLQEARADRQRTFLRQAAHFLLGATGPSSVCVWQALAREKRPEKEYARGLDEFTSAFRYPATSRISSSSPSCAPPLARHTCARAHAHARTRHACPPEPGQQSRLACVQHTYASKGNTWAACHKRAFAMRGVSCSTNFL